jgi:hypothetical protein
VKQATGRSRWSSTDEILVPWVFLDDDYVGTEARIAKELVTMVVWFFVGLREMFDP